MGSCVFGNPASHYFRLVDVGDQRGDRRKWIYLFETVHTVLFFASLVDFSEPSSFPEFEVRLYSAILNYIQFIQTKLDESLEYFWFALESLPLSRKDSILFLTKKDILPIRLADEACTGPSNYPEILGNSLNNFNNVLVTFFSVLWIFLKVIVSETTGNQSSGGNLASDIGQTVVVNQVRYHHRVMSNCHQVEIKPSNRTKWDNKSGYSISEKNISKRHKISKIQEII